MKNKYVACLASFLLVLLACAISGLAAYLWWGAEPPFETVVSAPSSTPTPTATLTTEPTPYPTSTSTAVRASTMPTVRPSVTPVPTLTDVRPTVTTIRPEGEASNPSEENLPGIAISTLRLLDQVEIPARDRLELARRFEISEQTVPAVVVDVPPERAIGDRETFWVGESGALQHFENVAVLQYIGDHSYWWIQEGYDVSAADLAASVEAFETRIYPTNHEFFGSEWTPGVDSDPRIHIFIGNVPGVDGYFYSVNEYSRIINPYSNEKEMFYININTLRPGTAILDSTIAHEFQHMIHWYTDANEDTWVNEGLSELARQINGYETGGGAYTFSLVPDTQLNAWGEAASGLIAHYGNSYLFMSYFLDRFGEQMMRQVVSNPANGINGFNTVLQQAGSPFDFDAIFADWLVANYVDDPSVDKGFWGYRDLIVPQPALDAEHWQYPVERQSTVNQYAADYIAFEGLGQLTIDFEGMTQVKVAPTQAHSGIFQWWSNRGDDSDMTLTRRFDLSNVDQASLQFWIWYDVEKDWDYAFVEVSQDGGVTWDILPGVYSTMENKSGNSFGPAWTGTSGGGETAQWILESVDLTPYTGQVVDVRFEYLTDDAVNHVGLLLDDISIPEIAYFDDVEAGDGGWQAEGFVRMDNILPQKYVVQAIELGDGLQVERMQLDANNTGQLVIPLGEDVSRVVLVVSGITPFTTEPSAYTYRANLN